jgi:hypothetical protein
MADVTFIVHRDWLDAIEMLPIEQQDKIIADIIRHGTELPAAHADDPNVVSYVNLLRGRIDASKNDYAKKIENGKTNGRKKMLDSKEVYRLAQLKKSAKEIAIELGVGVDSIYHDDGWKNRNSPLWNRL